MSNTKYKLSYDEVRVIVIALVELKNQLIAEGRYTDPVDELLMRFVDFFTKGMQWIDQIEKFLKPKRSDFYNPYEMPDMEIAVKRIQEILVRIFDTFSFYIRHQIEINRFTSHNCTKRTIFHYYDIISKLRY